RIHTLIFAPSIAVVEKINKELTKKGMNLISDGRPIIGLSAKDLAELVLGVDRNCLIIPAHCLLPDENLHVNKEIRAINEVKEGDQVYTHKNRWKKVEKVFTRLFKGKAYQIIPDYFRIGIKVTGEHPFWAIKTKKNCRSISQTLGVCKPLCSQKKDCARRCFEKYEPEWIQAKSLKRGDVLIFPRFSKVKDINFIKLSDFAKKIVFEERDKISSGGTRRHKIPNKIKIDQKFCRLAGYYLAEGYTSRDLISFCFSKNEKKYLEEIKDIFKETFRIKEFKEYKRKNYQSIELTFYSKTLHEVFSQLFYIDSKSRKAYNKCLPSWMLELPISKQKEILLGWWRGDKGYTTSRLLMDQMKIICLRLGIIPSIGKDSREDHQRRGKHNKFEKRVINATHDTYHFSNLSFFDDKASLLNESVFKKFKTKMKRRRGWMDKDYIYLPIRKIKTFDYQGEVYNLEVESDNSYTAEFACVHNCWTPWFSMFGSKSGFDSIEECFGDMAKYIYGIETGLSSDPIMNWQVKDLDDRAILSFSDAHSGPKLGREATVFNLKEQSYEAIRKAIIQNNSENSENRKTQSVSESDKSESQNIRGSDNLMHRNTDKPSYSEFSENKILYTIEFHPEEGKYHYTGHRNCQVRQSPEETKKLGTTCPSCGRPLTVGVMHRVEQLAVRTLKAESLKLKTDKNGVKWTGYGNRPPYASLVPLLEILSEALGGAPTTLKIQAEYENLTSKLGSEFDIFLKIPIQEIAEVAGERVAEGIKKVRAGDIVVEPGYDGVFGKVKIWGEKKEEKQGKDEEKKQLSLF
ncbi:hypothetical protein ISS85_05490, partial [Candidatus Microgenomates bacterium]|nr:hypothetical protein [Candidatus Microgenomates bacterium]